MEQIQSKPTNPQYKLTHKTGTEYFKLETDPIVPTYNVITINQNLETVKKEKRRLYESIKENLFNKKCHSIGINQYSPEKKCKVVAYYENSNANWNHTERGLFDAMCTAYNLHRDIILSPDDVWMTILLQFSKYVNANAEKMRSMFVNHEGKKHLEVTTRNERDEEDWTEFFLLMNEKIRANTSDDIVGVLESNFSTTGHVEQLLSVATIMNTFKKYFSYGRCIPMCGLRNVLFTGELSDWTKLYEKLEQLEKYSVDDYWTRYVTELKPILNKFIDTFNGNVDKDFWDRVMNFRYGSLGSGSTSYVSGWILKFYGIYSEVDTYDIKEGKIDVDVKVINEITMEEKMMSIVGGITGITNIVDADKNIDAFKPQMAFIVFHDGEVKKL